jgi:hypothetical protein
MKPLLVAMALVVPLAVASPASAGGYVGFGLGFDAVLTGELDEHFDAEATGSGRLALGMRFGPVALEASAFGARFTSLSPLSDDAASRGDFTPISLGVDLKYHLTLLPRIEPYARGGLNRTWLMRPEHGAMASHSGRGYALGGGVQLPFRALMLVQASIWADYTMHATTLESPAGDAVGGRAHMMMLGISVGTRL